MSNVLAFIFLLLSILFFIALIIGLVKPELVVRWGIKRTRKQVAATYITASFVSFFLFVIFIVNAISSEERHVAQKQQEVAEQTAKEIVKDYKETKKEEPTVSIEVGKEAVTALESNDFVKFADEYKKLGTNKTTVWDNQLHGKKVTWTGTVVDAGSSQLFVYGLGDYAGESWAELGDKKKLFYTFTAKYADPNQFKGLKTGDTVTVEGDLESRGDYDLNYNWKIYNAVLK